MHTNNTCDSKLALADAWLRTSFCKFLGAVKYVPSGGLDVEACCVFWAIGSQQVAIWGAVNCTICEVHWPVRYLKKGYSGQGIVSTLHMVCIEGV
eukprot:118518-Chlamydomonas_euryale.AAC.1